MSGCKIIGDGPAPVEPAPEQLEATAEIDSEAAEELPAPTGEATNKARGGPSGGTAQDSLPLAARVNGQPIFYYIYEQRVAQMEQALNAEGMATGSSQEPKSVAQIKEQVLDGLIEEVILEQQADRLGITVSDQVVEATVQEISQKQESGQLSSWLAENQLTYSTFRQTVRKQLLAQRVFQHVTGPISQTADQIQVRYIRTSDEETARTVMGQLKAGTGFRTVAQAEGLDQGAGDLSDWFPRQLSPVPMPVTAALFSLEPGQMSGPIQTVEGFFVVKLEGRERERPLAPETFRALQQKVFTDWLQEQRSAATIERFAAF